MQLETSKFTWKIIATIKLQWKLKLQLCGRPESALTLHCEHWLGIRKINFMLSSAEGISHGGKQHEHRLTLIPENKLCQNHFELSLNHDNTKLHSWIESFSPQRAALKFSTWATLHLRHENCCIKIAVNSTTRKRTQHVHELQITIFYFLNFQT